MQINGISRQLLGPLQFDTSSPSTSAGAATAVASPTASDSDAASLGPGFHQILSGYDVTNITPRQFSELVQELHDSGEINDDEFRQLSRMRMELEQAGIDADEPMNLVEFFEKKLADLQADDPLQATGAEPNAAAPSNNAAAVAETNRQLDWVHKFALVQASGADGVDVGA